MKEIWKIAYLVLLGGIVLYLIRIDTSLEIIRYQLGG